MVTSTRSGTERGDTPYRIRMRAVRRVAKIRRTITEAAIEGVLPDEEAIAEHDAATQALDALNEVQWAAQRAAREASKPAEGDAAAGGRNDG